MKRINRLKRSEASTALIFLLPSLIGFMVFFILPFAMGIYYSLIDNIFTGGFAGLNNYKDLFESSSFKRASLNTLLFSGISVPLNMIVSLILAMLVNQKLMMRNILRTMLVSPLVVPVASVVLFWQIVFNGNGAANKIILLLGGRGIDWFNSSYAIYVIITIYLWKNLGYSLLIFLAGLQNIPVEFYESARIDGAGFFRRLFSITLVYLTPTTFFVFIMSIINSFKIFRETYLIAGEYPHESIYMLQHYINNTFVSLDYQKLTSAAFVMSTVIYLIVLNLFFVERKISRNM